MSRTGLILRGIAATAAIVEAVALLPGLHPGAGHDASSLLLSAASWAPSETRGRPAYDVAGLAFFKSTFDPIWLPRYGAVRHGRDLPRGGFALLELHLGGSLRGIVGAGLAMVPAAFAARRHGRSKERAAA